MTSPQPGESSGYNVRHYGEQQPEYNQQQALLSGGLSPEDAPRMRSSTFGAQYGSPANTQAPPNFQRHPSSQSIGSLPPQSPMLGGPSNTRPSSYNPSSVSSVPQNMGQSPPTSVTTSRPSTTTRSPFTPPIACPPRTRSNQILLINPTSTPALTNLILNTLRPNLPHALEVTAYNAPYPAPTAVESMVDSILSSETVLRDLAKYTTNNGETIHNYDGLLVACYSKHPLIEALRESYDVPVVGIMEASLYVARMLGGRFGIVSTSTRAKIQIDDAVAAYGLSQFFVGSESLHINPLEVIASPFTSGATSVDGASPSTPSMSRSREELQRRLATQSRALVAKGADTVILGSEFLTSNEAIRIVKDAVRDEDGRRTVNVVDAVEAGVLMLNSLVGMGVPTSKKGVYRGEREGRRGRGQNWL